MMEPSLTEWNYAVLRMVQALCGAISPNMRMIFVSHEGDTWILNFILERDDPRDREESEDAVDEFVALQDGPVECVARTEVRTDFMESPRYPNRVVYRRREDWP